MGKAGKAVTVILVIALVLSLGFGGFLLGSVITGDYTFLVWLGIVTPGMSQGGDDKPSGGGLVIDPSAGDYVAPVIDSTVEPNVAIPGWGRITIPSGTTQITSVDFYNPEENEGLYYLTFELRLPTDDGGYISLYQSDAVPPGKHIQSITLSRPLETGTYDAVIHVQPYRMSDETPTNNANMKTTLVVV